MSRGTKFSLEPAIVNLFLCYGYNSVNRTSIDINLKFVTHELILLISQTKKLTLTEFRKGR